MKILRVLFYISIIALIVLAVGITIRYHEVDQWSVEVIDIQNIGDKDYLFFKLYESDETYYINSDMNSLIFYDLEVGDLITVHKYVHRHGFEDAHLTTWMVQS